MIDENKRIRSWEVGRELPVLERSIGDPSANRIRQEVLLETLHAFDSPNFGKTVANRAFRNVANWRTKAAHEDKLRVDVIADDWGTVTQKYTKMFGEIFAVLNMANAYVPGGGYTHGTSAQEENMFRRSDCHFYINDDIYDHSSDRYTKAFTRLLKARHDKVYLDTKTPRICVRGYEDRSKNDLGYVWLKKKALFPFYELRAAAQDLRNEREFSEKEARKRISAQLDTLIEHDVKHAILSAFGCGVFQNPAYKVAAIYKEEIGKREAHFKAIVFAIFYAGYGADNFTPFAEIFKK